MPRAEILQGSCNVEDPPASERPAAYRGNDVREPVCDGIGMDDEWEHQ